MAIGILGADPKFLCVYILRFLGTLESARDLWAIHTPANQQTRKPATDPLRRILFEV